MTGGAGFIGSHLAESLIQNGDTVTVLDNFDLFYDRQIKQANLAGLVTAANFQFVEADIRDAAALAALPGDFDAIIHLAALAGVHPSVRNPRGFQDVNVRGTMELLEFARERKIPHFVFASSSSVYGVNPNVPWREDDAVLMPISPYASTKVSGELLGHVYAHLHGIRFIGLRFFTVYGPRQRPDLAIHKFLKSLREGRPIPVFGDGGTQRDYSFVSDIVAGIRAALNYTGSRYEIVNLGCGRPVKLLEMIRTLEDALAIPAQIEWLPEQPGDVPQTYASIDKARRILGFEPKVQFAEGVARFVSWLRETERA